MTTVLRPFVWLARSALKLVALFVVIVAAIITAVALIVLGVNHSLHKGDAQSAFVAKRIGRVRIGSTPKQVRAVLGKPERTDVTSVDGAKATYWYYGTFGKSGSFQLVFRHGRLADKNRY